MQRLFMVVLETSVTNLLRQMVIDFAIRQLEDSPESNILSTL